MNELVFPLLCEFDTGDGIIKLPQGPYGPIRAHMGPIWALWYFNYSIYGIIRFRLLSLLDPAEYLALSPTSESRPNLALCSRGIPSWLPSHCWSVNREKTCGVIDGLVFGCLVLFLVLHDFLICV